ncbi:MAG: hypothetical protein ABEJ86_03270, partial [Halococcoides sp.]
MDSRVGIATLGLVLALVASGAIGPAIGATTDLGSLQVEDGQTGVASPGTEISMAFHAEADTLRSELAVASLETRLDRAESDAQRRAAVRSAVNRLQTRVAGYRAARKRVGTQFAHGDRSADSLALALARVAGDATRIRTERAAIQSMVAKRGDVSLTNGLESALAPRSQIDGEALALKGPIRKQLRQGAVSGEQTTVIVTASDQGIAMSWVRDGTYKQTVTRWDRHNPGGTNTFRDAEGGPVSAAYERSKTEYYAAAYDRAINSGANNPSILTYGGTLYRVTFPFDGGRIRAFIDGNTTAPFHELQRRSIEDLDPRPVANHTGDGLTVTVNGTYDGGPVA